MNLKYNEILVRNASLEDVPNLLKWWNDGRVMEHAGFPLGLNTTDNRVIQNIKNHDMINNALLIIEYNKFPIGEMNYKKLDHKSVEIGIKICEEEYQNRGLGKIILSLLISELFSKGFEKIVLSTTVENKRAHHVYKKLGFVNTEIKENSWTDQLGNIRSSVIYELIEENFNNQLTKRKGN